jgi:acetyl-CoA synthetase
MTSSYETAVAEFGWDIPAQFNIGVDMADKWAAIEPDRVAIIAYDDGEHRTTSFAELALQSNRLANLLVAMGLQREDRVAVLAPQRPETAVAHAAIFKAGGISVPLFSLFGSDALHHRLADSGTRFVIADAEGKAKVQAIGDSLPALERIIDMDDPADGGWGLVEASSGTFTPVPTRADDPALIIYTSGTTGSSKGTLHAHRVLLGHLPGVEMSHGGLPRPGDCLWTPADWAWIGGLLDIMLPALHHGVPVVAKRFEKFDADEALRLMQDCAVTAAFLPPTALRMLRQVPDPGKRWQLALRSIASGGESLGEELLTWAEREFGIGINEFYGQTECNMIVSSCGSWFPGRPGAMGRPVPGHDVRIIDDAGNVLPPGEEGHIAVRAPDPVMLLRYWNNPAATTEKFIGDMLVTGDRGIADADGFLHFIGRSDDVITSAGYRIGPGEIEDCLLKHPAVATTGVVGVPDALRTEAVTAFVVLREGVEGTALLARALQDHVRSRLGGHQYPRAVHFVAELPMTITGKIVRRELRRLAAAKCERALAPDQNK